MMTPRLADDRGHAKHGWLDSHHTFSFASYHDPKHMGFRALRVINDDRVAPGQGFGGHPHRDMEIISYVLEGQLAHKDSMGTGSVIVPGDVQRMSAGTGVTHSEYNASKTDPVHFLQIWLLPKAGSIAPGYEQKTFTTEDKLGKLRLVASPTGQGGSVTVHSDASLYAGLFDKGHSASVSIEKGRHAWVHVASGEAIVNGKALREGDGASFSEEPTITVEGNGARAEVLVFDLG